jgi:hypothetical protein
MLSKGCGRGRLPQFAAGTRPGENFFAAGQLLGRSFIQSLAESSLRDPQRVATKAVRAFTLRGALTLSQHSAEK